MRKVAIIVTAVLVVLCGGLGWTGYQWFNLGRELVDAGVTQEQFDAQKVGADEKTVRDALPEPLSDIAEKDLYGDDQGRNGAPAGSSCVYYTFAPLEDAGPDLWRFCFADGKLAEKSGQSIPE
ncbi:hypothetical protein [Actinoplanes sp. NBRC 101535]|uniref:hypothetical protein n=1 Tax=Actinoplanes sp. NBRC 101535 TaxID=3032196 RepID=UPI0024A19DEA|nr:hypothetical protein [Actinoplanes sp. NBRC 101535]GLY05074.1 hypothetical protein Acsp01_54530 [Actinoplanes sp. NBRC 101535]